MGKETLLKGILTGAIVGGLITLCDKETRSYVTNQLQKCGSKANYYAKHPSEAMQKLNQSYTKCSEQLSSGLTTALEMLNQLENTTSKLENNKNNEQR